MKRLIVYQFSATLGTFTRDPGSSWMAVRTNKMINAICILRLSMSWHCCVSYWINPHRRLRYRLPFMKGVIMDIQGSANGARPPFAWPVFWLWRWLSDPKLLLASRSGTTTSRSGKRPWKPTPCHVPPLTTLRAPWFRLADPRRRLSILKMAARYRVFPMLRLTP